MGKLQQTCFLCVNGSNGKRYLQMIIIHVQQCGLLQCVRNTCFLIVFHFLSGAAAPCRELFGPLLVDFDYSATSSSHHKTNSLQQQQPKHSSSCILVQQGMPKGIKKPLQSMHIRCSLVVAKDYTLLKEGFFSQPP